MRIDDLTPHLLYQFKSEHELVEAILKISEAFTVDRSRIEEYLNDPKLVSAYTLFYLTTNLPKLKACLDLVGMDLSSMQLVDLGAGPGTFSLAWLNLFGGGQVVQWEKSKLMQEQSAKIIKNFYPHTKVIFNQHLQFDKKVLLFGHSMNEMGADLAMNFIQKENPEVVIFIEPGTKEVFSQMLEIREHLLRQNFMVQYPCLGSSSCPMNGTKDWCHQFLEVRHDLSVERLTQLVKKDRKKLPMIFHLYTKEKKHQSNEMARIVRVLPETKFSFEWEVCCDEDEKSTIERWQLMKKDYSKDQCENLNQMRAGEAVIAISKEMKGSYLRVKVK